MIYSRQNRDLLFLAVKAFILQSRTSVYLLEYAERIELYVAPWDGWSQVEMERYIRKVFRLTARRVRIELEQPAMLPNQRGGRQMLVITLWPRAGIDNASGREVR